MHTRSPSINQTWLTSTVQPAAKTAAPQAGPLNMQPAKSGAACAVQARRPTDRATQKHTLPVCAASNTRPLLVPHLTHTAPGDATMKLPSRAGGLSAPHVPSLTMAICPATAARASLTTKSMLGMPMRVVTMDTGTPSYRPVGAVVVETAQGRHGFIDSDTFVWLVTGWWGL